MNRPAPLSQAIPRLLSLCSYWSRELKWRLYVLLGNYLHAGYLLLYCYCKLGNSEIVCVV